MAVQAPDYGHSTALRHFFHMLALMIGRSRSSYQESIYDLFF